MSAIKYGLIGHPLGHSMSPYIHERIMEASGISGRYDLYDVDPVHFDAEVKLLMRELAGFNCTIPYKQSVISFLDRLDEVAAKYMAVNTVSGRVGYNTDRDGFLSVGLRLLGKKVLLLGAGGVSRMMAYEAVEQGATITIMARTMQKAEALALDLRAKYGKEVHVISEMEEAQGQSYDVILNGTPLGMWPFCGGVPITSAIFCPGQQVFDTVYNPVSTRMVLQANKHGAEATGGLKMLFGQALAAQKIWNPDAHYSPERLQKILAELPAEVLSHSPVKYIMTGFMGAGKTTVSRELGRRLHIPVIDLDERIEKTRGCSVSDIFERDGEAGFRIVESSVLKEILSDKQAAIIALGGGAILQEENRALIHRSEAMTIFLHASMECIWERIGHMKGRPLAGDPGDEEEAGRFSKVAALYEGRLPLYNKYCDVRMEADKDFQTVTSEIMDALGYGG